MKRAINIILAVFFSLSQLMAQKSVILSDCTFVDRLLDSTPTCIIEDVDEGVTVTYEFNRLNILPDSLYPSAVMPKINGFGYEHTLGKPRIPIRWDAIRLPSNTHGQVRVIDSAFVDIPMELSPARQTRTCKDEAFTTSNVPKITSLKGFYPSNLIPSYEQHDYRGVSVMNICICPVKYNSVAKMTRIYTKLKYKVTWTKNSKSAKEISIERQNANAEFLNNITLNKLPSRNMQVPSTLTTEDYLIISTTKYQSAVERLAEWKRILGYRVEVLYQNNWSTNDIKAYIQQFNSEHNNFSYLLFVGGYTDITSYGYYYQNTPYISDYQYSCLDNDDFPDIYHGRLLVSTPEDADIIVGKIINYERNPIKNEMFYETAVNSAVFEADSYGYERTRAVLTSELINKVVADSLQKNINCVYLRGNGAYPTHWNNSLYSYGNELPESVLQNITWNGTAKKMMDYIDNGSFYTLHIGHGDWDKWESLNLNKDSLDKLYNGIKYPVVFSMSCFTGAFHHNDCFAQHFCTLDGKGCVAIFAATCAAPWGSTEILGMDMFDAIWPNSYFNPLYPYGYNSNIPTPSPTYRLGQILNQGVYKMRMTWNYNDLYTSSIFHCFGDPSMRIYTQQPSSFDNAAITKNNGIISVNAGENDADISFYNKTTGEIVRYKGIQGSYNCGNDDVSICISAPNKIPYIDPLFIQNESVTGPVEYNGGIIKVGYSVTNQEDYGNVNFNSGKITIKGHEVELHSGTAIESGAEFNVETR